MYTFESILIGIHMHIRPGVLMIGWMTITFILFIDNVPMVQIILKSIFMNDLHPHFTITPDVSWMVSRRKIPPVIGSIEFDDFPLQVSIE